MPSLRSTQCDIYTAAAQGHIDRVKHLLNADLGLLNIKNDDGYTALVTAVRAGCDEVVAYLLEQDNISLERCHDKTPLQWALEAHHYATANLIIHKTLTEQNKESFFDFIQSPELAFELMNVDPRNKELMLRNDRINSLINQSEQKVCFFSRTPRRPSFFVEMNETTRQPELFKKERELGKGAYGTVFKFVSETNKSKAVKYHSDLQKEQVNEYEKNLAINSVIKEQRFRQLAYGDQNTLCVMEQTIPKKRYQLRDIMEYIDGQTLGYIAAQITNGNLFVALFMKATEELITLHQKGIVHGDLKYQNIMVITNMVPFGIKIIDFGLSSLIVEDTANLFVAGGIPRPRHIAPELWFTTAEEVKNITPDSNQDVYSLGLMFKTMLIEEKRNIIQPNILVIFDRFINKAMEDNPRERPLLHEFIEQLKNQIHLNQLISQQPIRMPRSQNDLLNSFFSKVSSRALKVTSQQENIQRTIPAPRIQELIEAMEDNNEHKRVKLS